MITATDEAKTFLADAIKKVALDTSIGECFRIAKEDENRLAIVTGKQAEGDVAITHEDTTVLVVETDLATEIGDRTLDVRDAGQGQKALFWA
jgi:hypothetical protein